MFEPKALAEGEFAIFRKIQTAERQKLSWTRIKLPVRMQHKSLKIKTCEAHAKQATFYGLFLFLFA